MIEYCEKCEAWVETDNNRCIYCNSLLKEKKKDPIMEDEWDLDDEDFV